MKLRYITCSDPREDTPVEDVLRLSQVAPNVEIAVQAHPSKMSFGMPRNEWFCKLLQESLSMPIAPNLAVHVNMEWCNKLCQGEPACELLEILSLTRQDNAPAVRRWQVNIHGSKTQIFDVEKIAKLLKNFPDQEFIFQYGPSEFHRMQKLNDSGVKFSVLYDVSSGQGLSVEEWHKPLFTNHPQGYAGGLSPENVAENLDKISKVAGNRSDLWIDAEGKLKIPGTKTFDINRAKQYIKNARTWEQKQR